MDDLTRTDTTEARRRAVTEMERLLEAAVVLREELDGHVAICQAVLEGVRNEDALGAVLDASSSRTWRPKMTDALTAYERLRHRARLRLIGLGVAEGMTVADVERHWSITRQLANRSIREAGQLD
jgi:hypothetical protein